MNKKIYLFLDNNELHSKLKKIIPEYEDDIIKIKELLEKKEYPELILTDSGEIFNLINVIPDNVPIAFIEYDKKTEFREKIKSYRNIFFIVYPFGENKILYVIKNIENIKNILNLRDIDTEKKDLKSFIYFLSEKYKFDFKSLWINFNIYSKKLSEISDILDVDNEEILKDISRFLNIEYFNEISPEYILKDLIPLKFARKNRVVGVNINDKNYILLPDPFDYEIIDAIKKMNIENFSFAVTSEKNINTIIHILDNDYNDDSISVTSEMALDVGEKSIEEKVKEKPLIYITNRLIENAINNRASDIHIEPKESYSVVRFRIDGDLMEFAKIKKETANMIITRLKAMASMDIAERRKPQDGAVVIRYRNNKYTLRLATTSTNYGESLVIRIINNDAKPLPLSELGMYQEQEEIMEELSKATQGIILVCAPTGSGKTTTIYSFLSSLDLDKKSLITVEDPIEYRIPKANQQQVNEKADVTFSNLLKSSVRQDPDILFIGEIRDEESAKIAFDFSSTGHLTISTIHTANSTTAILRLERFKITRQQMAETILALISQRLLKKLCNHCKVKVKATEEQKQIARKFKTELKDEIYEAKGCPKCNNTGYFSRNAVYEIIKFDKEISDMVAGNETVKNIRKFLYNNNFLLMPVAAIRKINEGIFDFKQVYDKILAEELIDTDDEITFKNEFKQQSEVNQKKEQEPQTVIKESSERKELKGKPKILVVDDDPDMRNLLKKILVSNNYDVELSDDGLDAIIKISKNSYDIVLSDIDMPNLDGLKLVETVKEKKLNTRIFMLTASSSEDAELKALEKGAVDFIKKPFKKEVLLLRLKKALMGD